MTPAWLAAHQGEVRVVDVREPTEFRDDLGHIEGAELVPLDAVAIAARGDEPRPIITVCRSGTRSAQAVQILHDRGVDRVASMAGGMIAWSQAGLPVSRR